MKLLDWLGRILFPPKCVLCRKILEKNETDLCRSCREDSPECTGCHKSYHFLDSWTAVWYYEGLPRKSILRYKFRGIRSYAACYGRMLAMRLQQTHPEGFDILTWVPTSSLRKFKRGYDQSELIARAVGAELGMEPVQLLKKVRNNSPQSRIQGEAQRRANVLGVYRVTDSQMCREKRILMVDDIITTGATAGEAARILLTAGGKEIHCGTVAVTRRQRKQSR